MAGFIRQGENQMKAYNKRTHSDNKPNTHTETIEVFIRKCVLYLVYIIQKPYFPFSGNLHRNIMPFNLF